MDLINWTYHNKARATGESAGFMFEIVRENDIWIGSGQGEEWIAKGHDLKKIHGGDLPSVIAACENVAAGCEPVFAVRLLHLAVGWRYWAFHRHTGYDTEYGLSGKGYGTEEEAWAAVKQAMKELKDEDRS